MQIRFIMFIVVVMLCSGCVSTEQGYKVRHDIWEPVVFAPLRYGDFLIEDQGPFVEGPAGATLIVTALPGMIIDIPLLLLYGFHLEEGKGEEAEGECWAFWLYLPLTASAIVATPFRVTKEVFWDFPKWAVSGKKGGDEVEESPADHENATPDDQITDSGCPSN